MYILFIISLFLILTINFIFALKSILYRKNYHEQVKQYDPSYTPEVAIFIPCKGIEEGMQSYLEAMLSQNYENYSVYFITESTEDPAYRIVAALAESAVNVHVVVAGKASECCQKNHNLLAAIKEEQQQQKRAEIYIFADADVKPSKNWLRDLILPMSSEKIAATTAFRWLKPVKFTFWGTMHAMLSAYLGTLMSSSQGMWGGSMAIKREFFEKYNVEKRWSKALGDDIPLMEIIIRNNLKRIFVPVCTAESTNVINNGKELFEWFVRQNQYLKIYCFPFWVAACILTITNTITVISAPFVIILLIFIPSLHALILPTGLFLFLMLIIMSLSRFEGKEGQSYPVWFFMAYPSMIMGFSTLMISGVRKEMMWRGIRYGINKDGTTSFVKRETENG